ncbi:DNA mismatch repair protein MLH3 isoform X1 [Capsicum annuum]|uniref:DNA mismatch repair protein MLH3 isoform X1 n=1 Tax=Capsicum annuum TaxID=4072 RepID=UPI0007BF9B67|nr:DNA mismatch repair protein MLH3 isoform X1 [Capsicum annuum]XP_047263113.1 DNA mismatch repair protein MLH3 isoform X1 [Capsicum annuum]
MGSIKRMPEAIWSRMRSGVILYDFTRIVEELVFNSLDAGATKVYVAIGIGTCYVKVDDNGSGVSRDGLVLMGERYATSKYSNSDDMHAFPTSFGFKGEALNSISDVSLLEIVSKIQGRPNGYRKVLKDGKCLYLGIDDSRQDVGTTVIVRDAFYNQPVRRKQMHSNPKRVLHSLKESLLRIALVHPSVSFKIIDIESEDDLLWTHASPSPLPLLSSGFGIHLSSLNKLNASAGSFKLSGYISGPDVYTVKVLQYFYINSRFVSKGPIHKLLNNLAMSFDSASDIEQRGRSQRNPLFFLNLNCPRSLYDLTLEPSKTSVEFKDWRSVLLFVEDTVVNLWTESNAADIPVNYETGKKRSRAQSCKATLELPSPQPKKLTGDCTARKEIQSSQNIPWESSSEKHDPESRFLCQMESSSWSIDGSLAHGKVGVNWKSRSSVQPLSSNVLPTVDDFLDSKFNASASSSYKSDCLFGSGWEDESQTIVAGRSTGDASFRKSFELDDSSNVMHERREPFMRSCSLHRSLIHDGASFDSDEDIKFEKSDYRTKQNCLEDDCSVEFEVVDDVNQVLNQRSNQVLDHRSPRRKEIYFENFSRCKTPSKALQRSRFLSGDSEKSSLTKDILDEDDHLMDFVKQTENYGSGLLSFSPDPSPLPPDPFLGTRFQVVNPYIAENGIETSAKHEFDFMYNFGNMEHNILVPAISNWEKEDCFFPDPAKFDLNFNACSREDMGSIGGLDSWDVCNSGPSEFHYDGDDLSRIHSHGEENLNNSLIPRAMLSSRVDVDSHKWIDAGNQGKTDEPLRKKKKTRSHSAPPFYQGKKFFATGESSRKAAGNNNIKTVHDVPLIMPETRGVRRLQHSAEAICSELPQQSSNQCDLSSTPSYGDSVFFDERPSVKTKLVNIWNSNLQTQGECTSTHDKESNEEFAPTKTQSILDSGTKWRDFCPEVTYEMQKSTGTENLKNQDTILNVTSGILHMVGDSLIPDTIDKNCLEGAKVLQQVDKKFIPIVAGTTLAIIDQHAADERICLEELRDKVLSGQKRTTTYLDSEQELVMPEIGHQLLLNYADQIQNWGWICNIHSQASRSFSSRNLNLIHKQPTSVTLLAVPCILGVNLTDVDLLEFLQQLADTDGSSIVPPSVNRVLNNKACRSAIMFGDALLPSECSLIVEELKQTSLCFQCAHGRPTTVPLVNLRALHDQIAKLGSLSRGSSITWHGLLHRREINLERAAERLKSAAS